MRETGTNPHEPVEDTRQVDILTAGLHANGDLLHAEINVDALVQERTTLESHSYELGFTSGKNRYYLTASQYFDGSSAFALYRSPAGTHVPEDDPVRSGAEQYVDEIAGHFDFAKGKIVFSVSTDLVGLVNARTARLADLRVITGAGFATDRAGAYESADTAATNRSVAPYTSC